MNEHAGLYTTLIFLAAAVIAVPLFRRVGLASVLGYLAAGSVIGPWGLGLIKNVQETLGFAELGVVFLLFIIGLELKPARLWVLRRSIFGSGGLQVSATSLILFGLCTCAGLSWSVSFIVAVSLAFSSTAFALQILAERKQLSTSFGRTAFSILLFQDLAAIPLIAAVPFLDPGASQHSIQWMAIGKVVIAFGLLILASRTVLRRVFRMMAAAKTTEIFTAATLLLVLGVALLMESLGLSMALGSFLAGVLLADSEYRHELEADIEPFKGLLLGLFFMAIGMTVDYGLLIHRPLFIVGLSLGLLFVKILVNYFVGRRAGLTPTAARNLAFVIPQGGEFAFVVFAAAVARGVMNPEEANILVVVVTLTMALTPPLVAMNDKYLWKVFGEDEKKPYDKIESGNTEIIVAGFGRFGQVIGRILLMMKMEFTALEADADQVEVLRKFGNNVYYGDASKLELLRAAGAEKARVLVVAIDDMKASLKTVAVARQNFPHLKILARARNREHVFRLLDLGVTRIWRETYGSSLEMAEGLLEEFGFSAARVKRATRRFRSHDEELLIEQHKVYQDQTQLIDVSKRAQKQLIETLEADREEGLDIQDYEARRRGPANLL
jgi:monovalent cation:proton antiporter-2 (CPA2) family protein